MMEVGIPLRGGKDSQTEWVKVRYDRAISGKDVAKRITVSGSPLKVTLNPWLEGGEAGTKVQVSSGGKEVKKAPPGYLGYEFKEGNEVSVTVKMNGK